MSWGTSVDAEIYFSRKTYRDRYDMEQDMKEQEHVMDMAKNNLMIYAASDPKMFRGIKDDEGYPVEFQIAIRDRVEEALNAYAEAAVERYRLSLLEDNWDKRDGDYVWPEREEEESDDENETEGEKEE